jgi:hypothetical protein
MDESLKEQYIKMRNSNRIDAAVLYTFAREQGFDGDTLAFMQAMQFWDISEMFSAIDRKLGLTLLFDKNNKFIKIIE